MTKKWIDVEVLIKGKAPGLYRFLPRFFINYARRKLHEDEINAIINNHLGEKGIDFANSVLIELGAITTPVGLEHIPIKGGCLFACNHPLGGLDGMAIISAIAKVRTDIRFFVNEVLLELKNLENIFMPVNIYGHNSRQILKEINQVLSTEIAIPIFPAGLVSRKQNDGEIHDLSWKKSFITQAKRYHKDIIPVWVEGRNSDFFYNFAKRRKKMGIKLNIEMFLLPDEMFRQRGKNIEIHFGNPVSYNTFNETLTDAQWAYRFQEELYRRKKDVVKEFILDTAPDSKFAVKQNR